MIKSLLFPFSILYDGATRLRNHLYNISYSPSIHFETTVLSVGNLSVGGTGKTPMIEYLIRLLKEDQKLATLSRGYGRTSKGFRIINEDDNARTAGDEPFQFYLKFGKEVTVAVGEERAAAIPEILYAEEATEIILLDDAYQHRKVDRDLNILLTTYDSPFFNDLVLPAGRLREARQGAKRADVVVVTKCPDSLSEDTKDRYAKSIWKYANPETPVFFSTIRYGDPQPVFEKEMKAEGTAVLVSGLANAKPFEQHVSSKFAVNHHFDFPDHHAYTIKDLQQVKDKYDSLKDENKFILTSEKDMVKMITPEFKALLKDTLFFYLPIEIEFLERQSEFDRLVLEAVRRRQEVLRRETH